MFSRFEICRNCGEQIFLSNANSVEGGVWYHRSEYGRLCDENQFGELWKTIRSWRESSSIVKTAFPKFDVVKQLDDLDHIDESLS